MKMNGVNLIQKRFKSSYGGNMQACGVYLEGSQVVRNIPFDSD